MRDEGGAGCCPYQTGDPVRFKPAAFFTNVAGFGTDLDVEVSGTVVQIHEEHRWYRAEYRTPGGTVQHETFKF